MPRKSIINAEHVGEPMIDARSPISRVIEANEVADYLSMLSDQIRAGTLKFIDIRWAAGTGVVTQRFDVPLTYISTSITLKREE